VSVIIHKKLAIIYCILIVLIINNLPLNSFNPLSSFNISLTPFLISPSGKSFARCCLPLPPWGKVREGGLNKTGLNEELTPFFLSTSHLPPFFPIAIGIPHGGNDSSIENSCTLRGISGKWE
jgi:hypothetical protein